VTAQAGPVSVEDRLRAIQAITDAALSRLDDREFLAGLLDRTREILQADTAAVLLLDFSSGHLIATAAAGLEEEVRQGVRIPVGRGFAGRIAAGHRPVILDQVDHTTVLNPILWAKGIKSLMGVPMVTGGRVIGVLHVGSLMPRQFTGDDIELLQLAADRAAAAHGRPQRRQGRLLRRLEQAGPDPAGQGDQDNRPFHHDQGGADQRAAEPLRSPGTGMAGPGLGIRRELDDGGPSWQARPCGWLRPGRRSSGCSP